MNEKIAPMISQHFDPIPEVRELPFENKQLQDRKKDFMQRYNNILTNNGLEFAVRPENMFDTAV